MTTDYQKEVNKIMGEFSVDPQVMVTNQRQKRRRPLYEDEIVKLEYKHKRQPKPPRPISFDQWIFPHINAQWYDISDKSNIAASGNEVVISFTVTQDGVFRWFGHMVDNGSDAQLWEHGKWTIRKNGNPYPPWVEIDQLVGLLNDPTLIFVPFLNGDVISIYVENSDGTNAHDFYTRIKGWTFVY